MTAIIEKNPSDATNKRYSEFLKSQTSAPASTLSNTTPTALRPPVAAEGRFKVLLRFIPRSSRLMTNLSTTDVIDLYRIAV
jgi:hypothetical protein